MTTEAIRVDDSRVVVSLGNFRLSLAQNQELMEEIGASQLVSIRRTFREQGSPAGSWVPLAESTIRRNPKVYGAGHKLLVRSGRLLNSIAAQAQPGVVTIGTSLIYAAVHQFGSRDRGVGIGPQTEAQSKATVDVKGHGYFRLSSELGTGRLRGQKRRIQGPRNARQGSVRGHARHQNIPPRPYLVFRPEDPARIAGIVNRYVAKARNAAGLEGEA
jgi:phage gpG-like protein